MNDDLPLAKDILHHTLARPAIPDRIAIERYGMTVPEAQAKGICIRCSQPKVFYESDNEVDRYIERLWYGKAALCFACYNALADELGPS